MQNCNFTLCTQFYIPSTIKTDNYTLAYTTDMFYSIFDLKKYTGSPQIVLFLRSRGTVLLRKPSYLWTDLVLKSQFMTFGFSKSLFLLIFKLFWALKLRKWFFGFILKHFLNYLSQILTNLQNFRQFST